MYVCVKTKQFSHCKKGEERKSPPLSMKLKDKRRQTELFNLGLFWSSNNHFWVKEFLAWSSVSYSLFASEIRKKEKILFVQSGVEALSLRLFYTLKCICLCKE